MLKIVSQVTISCKVIALKIECGNSSLTQVETVLLKMRQQVCGSAFLS